MIKDSWATGYLNTIDIFDILGQFGTTKAIALYIVN